MRLREEHLLKFLLHIYRKIILNYENYLEFGISNIGNFVHTQIPRQSKK